MAKLLIDLYDISISSICVVLFRGTIKQIVVLLWICSNVSTIILARGARFFELPSNINNNCKNVNENSKTCPGHNKEKNETFGIKHGPPRPSRPHR